MVAAGVTRPLATGARGVRGTERDMITDQIIRLVADDWADEDNCTLYNDQIEDRIGELQDERAEWETEGGELPEEEAAELRMWTAFRAEVERLVGHFGEAVMVPDEVFEKYARYEAEQEHGITPDDLGDYVDWVRWAEACKNEFSSVIVDGQRVWVK
jgi:hypothetical protein